MTAFAQARWFGNNDGMLNQRGSGTAFNCHYPLTDRRENISYHRQQGKFENAADVFQCEADWNRRINTTTHRSRREPTPLDADDNNQEEGDDEIGDTVQDR